MLNTSVTANTKPDSVRLEQLPDGSTRVLLAKNFRKVTTEYEDGATQTTYQYDEVVFLYPDDGTPTKTGIKDNMDEWWEYGSQPEESAPTQEERLEALEDAFAAVVDMIMGGE